MKKLILLAFLLIGAVSFAQEGVEMNRSNVLTLKEVPPIWPGCSGSINAKQNCFKQSLAKHIGKNFKFPKGYKPGSVKEKVIVTFVINKTGMPEIKKVTGGTKALQAEAKRNIMAIPKMKPGHIGGTPKAIQYTVPFTF